MSETNQNYEITLDRLLRTRGLIIEEFDKYIKLCREICKEKQFDTMDILIDFEELVMPAIAERLQKIHSKEVKLLCLESNFTEETTEET